MSRVRWHILMLWLAIAAPLVAAASNSPLADAVEARDERALSAIRSGEFSVNAPQPDGTTALHWAAYHDDAATARWLISAGADVNARNRYGMNALSLACINGSTAMVELLLQSGADPRTELPGGETALMTASRTGVVGPVKALLAAGADPEAKDRRDQTAIMWAAAEGNGDVVKALIEAGADFKSSLDSGFTPLLFAVREGKAEAVRVLLNAGADVNQAVDARKASPKALRKGTSPLMLAIENGHFELAVDLLKAGADPNDQRSGFTPLHAITWVRKPDRGDDGDPSPIGSGNLSSFQMVEALVQHGADVNARLERGSKGGGNRISFKGATPFFMAADTDDAPLMRLLVKLGADPLMPSAEGTTPLMVAAGVGTHAPTEEAGTDEEALEAVTLAIELGADVNAVDDNGETAMHGAAFKSLPDVVRLLAARGASIEVWNRKNKRGWTPLLIAQGFRPGNFKPAPATIAAIEELMLAAGITPPPPPPREKKAWEP